MSADGNKNKDIRPEIEIETCDFAVFSGLLFIAVFVFLTIYILTNLIFTILLLAAFGILLPTTIYLFKPSYYIVQPDSDSEDLKDTIYEYDIDGKVIKRR